MSSSLSDARDALVNAVVDPLSAYSSAVASVPRSTLTAPSSLKLLPLYVLALLKQVVRSFSPSPSLPLLPSPFSALLARGLCTLAVKDF